MMENYGIMSIQLQRDRPGRGGVRSEQRRRQSEIENIAAKGMIDL